MWRRLLLSMLLPLALVGCIVDRQQVEICRQAFAILADREIAIAPPEIGEDGLVTLTGTGDSAGRQLICRYGGLPLGPHHLDLISVTLDGVVQPEIDMIMLRFVLGVPTPSVLLTRPSPEPPASAQAAYLVQQLINGISTGAMLSLVAIGYSLVYGITGAIQFAYGEIFMLGGVLFVIPLYIVVAFGGSSLALGVLLALPASIAATALYGWTIGRLVQRPLFRANRLNALIAAIGLGMALREYVRLMQGTRFKWIPPLLHHHLKLFEAGGFGVYLAQTQLFILGLVTLFTLALSYLLMRSSWGRAYRACADDGFMASLLGIDIHGTIERTLVVGAGLAAVAGTCFALEYGEADPYMGFAVGLKALTAVVLGGIGTVTGALAGGLVVGLFEALWAGYIGSAYKDAAVFSLLAFVLILRPEGLFGLSPGSSGASQPGGPRA